MNIKIFSKVSRVPAQLEIFEDVKSSITAPPKVSPTRRFHVLQPPLKSSTNPLGEKHFINLIYEGFKLWGVFTRARGGGTGLRSGLAGFLPPVYSDSQYPSKARKSRTDLAKRCFTESNETMRTDESIQHNH